MKLETTYKDIFSLSGPIMIGSAVQQIIALTDGVFLYHKSELDFGAIGFVSVFYLMIAAIGYNFSKGGQIMIARRAGENNPSKVGEVFQAMLFFEFFLAIVLFLVMQYGGYYIFSIFTNSDAVFNKSLEYLEFRSYGVFFSYVGLSFIALYTGISRTKFILVDSILLAVANVVLNYGFIFGHLGLPELGIQGAGIASTIAEIFAFMVFLIYIMFDRKIRKYKLFSIPKVIDFDAIRTQIKISSPVVLQAVVGFGSWFAFFGIIENLGERPLAITNLVRMIYLTLSIPTWGFASGANTLISHYIGIGKRDQVVPLLWKISKICLLWTCILLLPILLFPKYILYPLFGKQDMSLIIESQPILYVMAGILVLFSVSAVFFNGLAATGATKFGLLIQSISAVMYLVYVYVVIEIMQAGLGWAWASEIFYWLLIFVVSYWFLKSTRWHGLKV
jgi:putative MATE family efflux protein